jgi:hypothetical protein
MKEGLVKRLALVLLIAALAINFFQAFGNVDSSALQIRKFKTGSIQQYRNDKAFGYENRETHGSNIWEIIIYRIVKLLSKIFTPGQQWSVIKIIAWLIMIASAVIIVLNLIGVDIKGAFARGPVNIINHEISGENVREMNIDELIDEAFAKKQWRLCVRYQYLKTLRTLTDSGMINWQTGKTNMDYYYELKAPVLRRLFLDITGSFENVWYGHYELTMDDYLKVKAGFEGFSEQVKSSS